LESTNKYSIMLQKSAESDSCRTKRSLQWQP